MYSNYPTKLWTNRQRLHKCSILITDTRCALVLDNMPCNLSCTSKDMTLPRYTNVLKTLFWKPYVNTSVSDFNPLWMFEVYTEHWFEYMLLNKHTNLHRSNSGVKLMRAQLSHRVIYFPTDVKRRTRFICSSLCCLG